MSDLRIGRGIGSDPFKAGAVALILAIGILGFVGMLVLGAYAPDLRSGRDGGTHALSNAGVGFSGIVALAQATGRNPLIVRDPHQFGSEDLLVVTPGSGFTELSPLFSARDELPTLYVLPKWRTLPDRDRPGWVDLAGVLLPQDPASLMAPSTVLKIQRRHRAPRALRAASDLAGLPPFVAPPLLQVFTGIARSSKARDPVAIVPLLTDGAGGIVLARIGTGPLYVLADPDLLSNVALKDPRRAAAALALLDWLNRPEATGIGFDVTANGLGHSTSPLKLAFAPPFLAMTLALGAVLALVGWHAIGRFGPVRPRDRAIAFGKAALVENSANLVRRAKREATLGGRYVQLVREQAIAAFGIPARLRDDALDAYLDGLDGGGGTRFSDLARAVETARRRDDLVDAARALHQWQETIR